MKKNKIFDRDSFCEITVPTIYNAIKYNILNVNELLESKRDYSIEKRPDEVDKHLVFGHYELDTVLGK